VKERDYGVNLETGNEDLSHIQTASSSWH